MEVQPDSAVQSCPAKPDRDDQRRSQAKGRDSEKESHGSGLVLVEVEETCLVFTAVSSCVFFTAKKEEAAPQIAGRSHLWNKRLHHRTLVENSI